MNRSIILLVSCVLVLIGSVAAQAETITVDSKVRSVTVYRGQALVTREVKLPNAAGELELVIPDLPAQVLGESVHAGAADGVKIRAVRYRTQAVAEQPQKPLAELDAKIRDVQRAMGANAAMMQLLESKVAYIEKLEGFTAATAKTDAADRTLNAKTISDMTAQIFEQRTALTRERIALAVEAQELQEQMSLLQRQRQEMTRGAGRTVREAVVFVTKPAAGAATISLSYLVEQATWMPAYNVRIAGDAQRINVEYLAQVQQMSGEDWTGVKLTLSTATPAMNAQSPLLVPMWITLQGADSGALPVDQAVSQIASNTAAQYGRLAAWQNPKSPDEARSANAELNRFAVGGQVLELNASEDVVRRGAFTQASQDAGLAVSYALEGGMDLASRADQQLVEITRFELPAESFHAAIPLLSTYVYRIAKATNTSDIPLLAGMYSAYVDGDFVGRGAVPIVARGQSFSVGLGVDTQLRCRRELMEKSDKVAWGSQVQTFNYRLRIENYKDHAVDIRLLDRIPATQGQDIEITLGDHSDKLSTDAQYLRDDRARGILRWDLNVAPSADGADVRDVTYSFEMKYAKDADIGKRPAPARERLDMDLLEDSYIRF